MGVEGVGIMNPCEIVHENQPERDSGWGNLMQNKLHEAQSLPRQYAGYYETLSTPAATLGQRTPYRILFYL